MAGKDFETSLSRHGRRTIARTVATSRCNSSKPENILDERKIRKRAPASIINNYKNPISENKKGPRKPGPKKKQSEDKLETDQRQTRDKVKAKPETNQRQSKDKLEVRAGSDRDKVETTELKRKQSEDKVEPKVETAPETKQRQTEDKVETKLHFSSFSDVEKLLISFIYEDCLSNGSLKTNELKVSFIAQMTRTPIVTVKKTIQRLEKIGHLGRVKFKNGRGGWTAYSISKNIYDEIRDIETRDKLNTKWRQSRDKVEPKVGTEVETSLSSSSSNIKLNTITTSDDWVQDIQTPENLKALGFGVGHIKQLKEKFSISPDQIQHGLETFAYDLENGELERLKARGVQNIIGYFFGAMKNGGYNSVKEGFISAEELAEQEMIERLEKKKQAREERKKKLEELLFEEWLETKTEQELTEIEKPVLGFMDTLHRASLRGHFVDNEMAEFKESVGI